MKFFKVIGFPLDCEGRELDPRVLKKYTNFKDAVKYKTAWETSWKNNTDNKRGVYPCWYDYLPHLKIREDEIEETFDGKI